MTSNGDPAPIGDAEVDRFVHGGLRTRDKLLDVFIVGRLARSHDWHRRAGAAFARSQDPELGLACERAWNDWHHEVWAGTYPDRIIPLQLAWLRDPAVAAAAVRRNAERGFKAVTFPESMNNLDLPSVHTDHWDPFLRACEETGTVVCIHTGSGAISPPRSPESPLEQSTTLFPVHGMLAAADWLWARIPLRFPRLDVALSEGGIGWVPMLLDRLDNIIDRSGYGLGWDVRPADVLQRNFWFCTLDDPSTIDARHRIGVENIMVETDYPHGDGTWPDTQDVIEKYWGHIPNHELRAMCSENAAALYRHPLPDVVLPR